MKKTMIGVIIICLFCFPYVYLSMYQDFTDGSMLGYLLMTAATSLFAFLSKLFSNSLPVIVGNILSVIVSFYFINNMAGSDGWGWYFTPLSPIQLLITVSLLNLIPQFFAMKFADKYKITFDPRPFASKKQT